MDKLYIDMTNMDSCELDAEDCFDEFDWLLDDLCDELDTKHDGFMVVGSVGLWNRTIDNVATVWEYARDAIEYCIGDCVEVHTIQIGQDDGDLTFTGAHHDGRVEFKIRALTDSQMYEFEDWENGDDDCMSASELWLNAERISC